MAKAAVLEVLDKTVGRYIENVDTESLSVAVWKGQVQIQNLAVNLDVVNQELAQAQAGVGGSQVRVVKGSVDSLTVQIPWRNLLSRSVVVHIQGVTLQVVQVAPDASFTDGGSANARRIKQLEQQRREEIDQADKQRMAAREQQQSASSEDAKSASLASRLTRKILENVQFHMESVHISLASAATATPTTSLITAPTAASVLTAGLVIGDISLATTNKAGEIVFVDSTTNAKTTASSLPSYLYKALTIEGLGFYVDDSSTSADTAMLSHEDMPSIREEGDEEKVDSEASTWRQQQPHDFVVKPFDVKARLIQAQNMKARSDEDAENDVKYRLQSQLDQLQVALDKHQLDRVREVLSSLDPQQQTEQQSPSHEPDRPVLFPQYRPVEPIFTSSPIAPSCRDWWKYAIQSVISLNRRESERSTSDIWRQFHRAFLLQRRYTALYKKRKRQEQQERDRLLLQSTGGSEAAAAMPPIFLTSDEQKEMRYIEQDASISIQGLMLWRNMADAQLEKEQAKQREESERQEEKKQTSYFSTFFAPKPTKPAAATTGDQEAEKSDTSSSSTAFLTLGELKDLEETSLSWMEELEREKTTREYKLCELEFVLGSLSMSLLSARKDRQPPSSPAALSSVGSKSKITDLNMGKVLTSLTMTNTWSYTFDFGLTSLEVLDWVTHKTFFPSILKNQEQESSSALTGGSVEGTDNLPSSQKAFSVQLAKASSGDQQLRVQLSTFVAVASPLWLKELQRFFSQPATTSQSIIPQNPVLAQSLLSGSVDLFYDAAMGESSSLLSPTSRSRDDAPLSPDTVATGGSDAMSDLSNALMDAWKTKTETKTSWLIELDLQAPIVVVPENCVDTRANVLVFDLGHLQLEYGNLKPSPSVQEWFRQHPRHIQASFAKTALIDSGSLKISSLSFVVGKASYWQRLVRKHDQSQGTDGLDDAIIEPISLTMDFGIESLVQDNGVPRVCVTGRIPSVVLALSPSQLSRILSVTKAWMRLQSELFPETEQVTPVATRSQEEMEDERSTASAAKRGTQLLDQARQSSVFFSTMQLRPFAVFHADMRLQRLSVKIESDGGQGMEAHLVSVVATISTLSDGSLESQLSMGWFWILDQLEHRFPRRQLLLAHSKLPVSPDTLAENLNYDLLGELKKLGAFDDDFAGSTDLADISFRFADLPFGLEDPLRTNVFDNIDNLCVNSILDARFSSLYVNWNPHAVKTIMSVAAKFTDYLDTAAHSDVGPVIISSPAQLQPRRRSYSLSSLASREKKETGTPSVMLIKAAMESFQVSLNSAKDDLPLYVFTMSRTKLSLISSEGIKLSLLVDDLKVATPEMGRTDPLYHTIVGLAPGRSESLLSVQYAEGSEAMETLNITDIDQKEYEACADISLSPMRMVYIQAQILALVEYCTEGILGALTSQAASSAVVAAAEIATSVGAKKFFKVQATGFEVILPQAAYEAKYLSVQTGSLVVGYTAFPDPGGGAAHLTLSDVALRDDDDSAMQESPIQMSVDVSMPPEDVGTMEDQAMKVVVNIAAASFLITKNQYAQFLQTLSSNIGEEDICLRDSTETSKSTVAADQESGELDTDAFLAGFTHAGIAVVDKPRQIHLDFDIEAFSLELCGQTSDDPIVRLAALQAAVAIKMLPDQEKSTYNISLQDLVCDDRRLKAIGRQYRSLIYRERPDAAGESKDEGEDLFLVSYETKDDGSSSVQMKIGSPRLVFIPDAISEALSFLDVGGSSDPLSADAKSSKDLTQQEVVEVEPSGSNNAIETSVVEKEVGLTTTLSFAMTTARCSIILVDLGSDQVDSGLASAAVSSVAEAIVLGGRFSSSCSLETDKQTGETICLEAEIHADDMETYTAFGRELSSPLQVVDPVSFSLFIVSRVSDPDGECKRTIDVRAAALTPLEISVSMRNVALIDTILASVADCFEEKQGDQLQNELYMSQQEADRVEHLATVLSRDDDPDSSVHSRDSSRVADPSTSTVSGDDPMSEVSTVTSVKLTLPESKFTLINDLQGLDEALLRVTFQNLVAGGQARSGERSGWGSSQPFTAFEFTFHVSTAADYFDASVNSWKALLLKPWELTSKGARGASRRFRSPRPSTTVDVESFPCHMSFSEQFLMSLASASRMWSVYSMATTKAADSMDSSFRKSLKSEQMKKSMAASVARTFVSALPYAVDNHAGIDVEFVVHGEREERRNCTTGTIEYFRFEPPSGKGSGGKRLYGQDVTFQKSVSVLIGDSSIEISDLDREVHSPIRSHELQNGQILMTRITKEGKTTVLHLTSGMEVRNRTRLPFLISMLKDSEEYDVGVCEGTRSGRGPGFRDSERRGVDGRISRTSNCFAVPIPLLHGALRVPWSKEGEATLSFMISPRSDVLESGGNLKGEVTLKVSRDRFASSLGSPLLDRFDVICRPSDFPSSRGDAFVLQVSTAMTLVNARHPLVQMTLEPRAVVKNMMPVALSIRTPMPHTFSSSFDQSSATMDIVHDLQPDSTMEIFTPGPSIAVTMKCTDKPSGGTSTDWMDGGWVDLPLVSEFRLPEPLHCLFPFVRRTSDPLSLSGSRGSEFFIAEGSDSLLALSNGRSAGHETTGVEVSASPEDADWRTFFVTVCNFAVDHTGDILFEQLQAGTDPRLRRSLTNPDAAGRGSTSSQISAPFGAYGSPVHRGRISLLPSLDTAIRLLHLTMEGDEGLRRSAPFRMEDISICDGGVDSAPIMWEDGTASGYFAYRTLVNEHQSELHVVPEYVVFNGSENHRLMVKQPGGVQVIIDPGKVAPLRTQSEETAIITVEYVDFGAKTVPLRVDTLGLRIALVKDANGSPVGSVAVQTVVGAHNSRLVVKLGEVKYGSSALSDQMSGSSGMLDKDFMRFRVQWTELRMTLNEARPIEDESQAFLETALDRIKTAASPSKSDQSWGTLPSPPSSPETWKDARAGRLGEDGDSDADANSHRPVCTLVLDRFTVDWQRVFKTEDPSEAPSIKDALLSPERSQLSIIVHNVQLRDETPNSPYPTVFDSTSSVSFFDLCIRCKGSLSSELVRIDLIDLNLAHKDGFSEKIVISTSEDFVWKLLDLGNRILAAASEFAGVDIELKWDEEHGGYVVAIRDKQTAYLEGGAEYSPPVSDQLYDINRARVSPFTIIASFKRNPQASRYKQLHGVRGANLMNYFTRRLKFKIEKAELKFSRYEVSHVKGPADRLIELLSTVYLSRMKLKIVTIMTAASFQDWKFLASRDGGDDEFVEGDLLRVTGNVAGNTAGYVLKKAGVGLGHGVSNVASRFGDTIETATGAIGAEHVGAGLNSLVSGVGGGFGDTLSGVGTGAGKVFKGAGQGVGQVFGGVAGGAVMIGKGVGKGITTGDGQAIVSGVTEGVASAGTGVGQGVEAVVTGTTEGIFSVGQGLVSGVKSVGRGIGGAFAECCSCLPCCAGCCADDEEAQLPESEPLLPRPTQESSYNACSAL